MAKLKNKSNIGMCFSVALSQTYWVLKLLAYPTSIGSHPESLFYTLQFTVCFVGGKEHVGFNACKRRYLRNWNVRKKRLEAQNRLILSTIALKKESTMMRIWI